MNIHGTLILSTLRLPNKRLQLLETNPTLNEFIQQFVHCAQSRIGLLQSAQTDKTQYFEVESRFASINSERNIIIP